MDGQTTTTPIPRSWCSLIARERGEDPIGSVSSYDLELAVELPLPWARAVAVSPHYPAALAPLPKQADATGTRLRVLAIAPDAEQSEPGWIRVLALRRLPPAVGVAKEEYLIPTGDLAEAAPHLLAPDATDRLAPFRRDAAAYRDLLVCTHGTRDACCATSGVPLYDRLRAAQRDATGVAPGAPRVWRTSHLGGHRFAPTLLDLADGRTWGHLDEEATDRLLRRDGVLPHLGRHYRGWGALDSAPAMAGERAVFEREGWAWADYAVEAEEIPLADGAAEVRLRFVSPDGTRRGAYAATVEPSGVVVTTLGSCGDLDPRASEGWRVSRLTLNGAPLPVADRTIGEPIGIAVPQVGEPLRQT